MKKAFIIGIIAAIIIIGIASAYSNFDLSSQNESISEISETIPEPKKGTNYSINLEENIAMKPNP